jgi:hypothetical protein
MNVLLTLWRAHDRPLSTEELVAALRQRAS